MKTINNGRGVRTGVTLVLLAAVLAFAVTLNRHVSATSYVGAHSYHDDENGDVFLGGDFIELGISSLGSFGTANRDTLPTDFHGSVGNEEDERQNNIGIVADADGFDVGRDAAMDYTLPGTPEARWAVGYAINDEATIASNSLLAGDDDESHTIPDNTVTNESSGSLLRARSVGTLNDTLETTQVISFNAGDKYFKTVVSLKNVGNQHLTEARYMNSLDPDNTVDKGGSFTTRNTILYTFLAHDGRAAVVADTSSNPSDPVYKLTKSRSPLIFYSTDNRVRVSSHGFTNVNPFEADVYNDAWHKGAVINDDEAITITASVGTLGPNQTKSFTFYTFLDSRKPTDTINLFRCGKTYCR